MIRPPGSSSLTSLSKWLEGMKQQQASLKLSTGLRNQQKPGGEGRRGKTRDVWTSSGYTVIPLAQLQLIHSPCYSPYINVLVLSLFSLLSLLVSV